jgi:hypothetical protein
MKKHIRVSGVNGVFNGDVEIIFNAKILKRMVNNRSTHDDEEVQHYVHRVMGFIDGKGVPLYETEQKLKVPELAEKMEKYVTNLLKQKADEVKSPTVEEILKERGYL